jgi:D-glycero-D-manno-heptose 1,7-bisphosphate phosphatase
MPDQRKAIFLDRDGTINEDTGYVSSPDELIIYSWAAEAIRLINGSDFMTVIVTNQSGVARGLCTEETLGLIHSRLTGELGRQGARIDAIYYCPHHPRIGDVRYRIVCECRKPRPGMLLRASDQHHIDLTSSYVIGDKTSDLELAGGVGACAALVLTGYGRETLAGGRGPDIIADNLLEAVKRILDKCGGQGLEI